MLLALLWEEHFYNLLFISVKTPETDLPFVLHSESNRILESGEESLKKYRFPEKRMPAESGTGHIKQKFIFVLIFEPFAEHIFVYSNFFDRKLFCFPGNNYGLWAAKKRRSFEGSCHPLQYTPLIKWVFYKTKIYLMQIMIGLT